MIPVLLDQLAMSLFYCKMRRGRSCLPLSLPLPSFSPVFPPKSSFYQGSRQLLHVYTSTTKVLHPRSTSPHLFSVMPHPQVNAVLFDMDGLMIDSERMYTLGGSRARSNPVCPNTDVICLFQLRTNYSHPTARR